ncbi:MAG: hypothetical protein Q4G62_00230 [Pseudomonadota bacterium]|nr:hypothetical protein [Pseudomonadota bacterium]
MRKGVGNRGALACSAVVLMGLMIAGCQREQLIGPEWDGVDYALAVEQRMLKGDYVWLDNECKKTKRCQGSYGDLVRAARYALRGHWAEASASAERCVAHAQGEVRPGVEYLCAQFARSTYIHQYGLYGIVESRDKYQAAIDRGRRAGVVLKGADVDTVAGVDAVNKPEFSGQGLPGRIPLHWTTTSVPEVSSPYVVLNIGGRQLKMLFDTGAERSVMHSPHVAEFNTFGWGSAHINDYYGRSFDAGWAGVPKFNLAGLGVENYYFTYMEAGDDVLFDEEKLDGAIGMDIIRELGQVKISRDFIEVAPSPPAHCDTEMVSPANFAGDREAPSFFGKINGVAGLFMLDTGTNKLAAVSARMVTERKMIVWDKVMLHGRGAGYFSMLRAVDAVNFSMDFMGVHFEPADYYVDFNKRGIDVIIGMELIKNYSVYMDFNASRICIV